MAYRIQWRRDGVVKYFTGTVSFDEVIKSERDISGSTNYTALKYVISMYLDAGELRLTDSERIDIRALRLGGYLTNPRIKYAFVTNDVDVKESIEKSVRDGQTRHDTKVFQTYEAAVAWASS